jgi:hypothetical protein
MLFSLEGRLRIGAGEPDRSISPASYLENCRVGKGVLERSSRYEGHAVDALAPGAEEGRGRLR